MRARLNPGLLGAGGSFIIGLRHIASSPAANQPPSCLTSQRNGFCTWPDTPGSAQEVILAQWNKYKYGFELGHKGYTEKPPRVLLELTGGLCTALGCNFLGQSHRHRGISLYPNESSEVAGGCA